MLVGPAFGGGSAKVSLYALSLHVVRPADADVTFGGSRANLSQIGSPHGSTLASDPWSARSRAASATWSRRRSVSAATSAAGNPAAVAVGVRKPASDSAKPHAIACVAWSSQAAAAQYTTDARKALSSGLSTATNQPYSTLLSDPSVTDVGGSQHIVQWQAVTSGRADLIFEMYVRRDLPGLPDCTRVPPSARSRIIGCG